MRAAFSPTYNSLVILSSAHRSAQPQSLWLRFAAFLSFLAVLSALVAPVSMLAEDVRTGKLGGICSLNTSTSGSPNAGSAGNDDAVAGGPHCDLCGSLALALPLLALLVIPSFPGSQVAAFTLPAALAASSPGLPPGRGPPAV